MKTKQPPPHVPRTWFYIRVSSVGQAEHGVSLEAQEKRVREYAEAHKLPNFVWPPVRDAAQSGTKHFLKRKHGRELENILNPGDHLVIAKLDRAFRSCYDFLHMTQVWDAKRVNVHLLDVKGLGDVDLKSPVGKFMMTCLAAIAELESGFIGQRIREAKSVCEYHGGDRFYGGYHFHPAPLNSEKRWVKEECRWCRKMCEYIWMWRKEKRLAWETIQKLLARQGWGFHRSRNRGDHARRTRFFEFFPFGLNSMKRALWDQEEYRKLHPELYINGPIAHEDANDPKEYRAKKGKAG